MFVDKRLWRKEKTLVWQNNFKSWKRRRNQRRRRGRLEARQNCDWPDLLYLFCTRTSPNTTGPTWFNKCCEFQRVRMAMGRGVRMDISTFCCWWESNHVDSQVRVFHAPGQSPYSVLVEQRGVDQLLLLESQVPSPCDKCSPSNWISGHSHPLSCRSWATEENVCQAMWRLWHPGKLALECRRGGFFNIWPENCLNCYF